jgi:hypothetical protein
MKLASPGRASDQVAALTGVAPAASDPGQPVRLALRQGGAAVAIAIPKYVQPQTQAQPKPAPQPQPQPVASRSVPKFTAPMPTYGVAAAVPPAAPPANPARVADVAPPAVVHSQPAPEIAQVAPPPPVAEVALFAPPPPALPQVELFLPPPPVPVIQAASYAPPKLRAAPPSFTRAAAEQRKARLQRAAALVRSASLRRGGSTAVVQLGAYGSPNRVVTAWNAASRRYSALRAYAPMSASFASSNGKVYRLSVRGFANQAEASALCSSMRRKGGSCFVRTVAGDAPVRIASR